MEEVKIHSPDREEDVYNKPLPIDPNTIPRPGTFDIPNRVVEENLYTDEIKDERYEREDLSGPGQSEIKSKDLKKKDKWSELSKGSKPKPDRSKIRDDPGLGMYQVQDRAKRKKKKTESKFKGKHIQTDNPGPGGYEIPNAQSKKGFSMAGRYSGPQNMESPGPGAYDPNLGPGNPQWTMGKRYNKEYEKGPDIPGPGTYNIEEHKYQSNAPFIGTSGRSPLSDPNTAPGPGAYEIPNRAVEGPLYTIREKDYKERKDNSPGPGHYDQDIKDRSPIYSMGKAERTEKSKPSNYPGPGTYEAQTKEVGPKWGFGGESKDKDFKIENPGPGAYNSPNTMSKIAYTMAGKYHDSEKEQYPGPGMYEHEYRSRSPQWSMGKESKLTYEKGYENPGPGTYTVNEIRPHSLAPVIKSSSRSPIKDSDNMPGPGAYEIPNRAVEGPLYTIRGKDSKERKENSPGPGDYDQDTRGRLPAYTIGTGERGDNYKAYPNPGPGSYETQGKEGGPQWGFGSEPKTKDFKVENPGPGTYDSPNTLSKIGYTMAGKYPESGRENYPGPGMYEHEHHSNSPQWSMGKQTKVGYEKGDLPGPGTYTIEEVRPHSFAPLIGSSSRSPIKDKDYNIGPGNYDIPNRAVEGPLYSMRGKDYKERKEYSPGPGDYDPNIKDKLPGYVMGTAERGENYKAYPNPGPGTYDTQGKEGGPKWGFGSEDREKGYKIENPGPGTYDSPNTMSKIAYTMAGKYSENQRENYPGPGMYEHDNRSNSPQWSMGKQPRIDLGKSNEIPGPGTYSVEDIRPHSLAPVIGTSSRPLLNNPNTAPGPGAYEIPNRAVEGPLYTFKGKDSKVIQENLPGPGHYDQEINDINTKDRPPAFSIGTAERAYALKNNPYPGPGTYETQGKEGGPKWVFGTESKDKDFKVENPGPGTYEIPHTLSNPAYTMTGKNFESPKDQFPGPGAYDPNLRQGSPKWSMGKQPRTDIGKGYEIPGPGTYTVEEIRPHSLAPVMLSAIRPPINDPNSAPGPGSYEIPNRAVEGPLYTIRGRENIERHENSPGPGHYDHDKNYYLQYGNPAFSMGTAERTDAFKGSQFPGPGTYETQGKEGGPKWGFGSEAREKGLKIENPGPGSYESPEMMSNIGYTMAGKYHEHEKETSPGPGMYELNLGTGSPQWSMGKQPRTDIGKGNEVPGPGTYKIEEARFHSLAPVMGTSSRPPLSDPGVAPGPGTYEIPNKAVEGPQYTIRGRETLGNREISPGPGHYDQDINDVNIPNRSPVFSMGTAPRADENKPYPFPGPGTYDTQGKEGGPKWGFGTESRDKDFKTENPGPGTYQYPDSLSKIAYTMTGRNIESPKSNFPGPGTYDQNLDTGSPQWSMGKQPRTDLGKGNEVPGPGTYTVEDVRPHSLAPVMGSSPRHPLSDPNAAPGPGTYEIANRAVEGPQYTMRGREIINDREKSPGPGHYDQNINDINIPNRSPVFSMGTAQRTDGLNPYPFPGPGTYETQGKEGGPKWGFGTESRDKDYKIENPGPGTYQYPDTLSKIGYTMAGKHPESSKDTFPGPGTYEYNLDAGSPQWSMGKQPRTDIGKGNDIPGPGTYNVGEVRPHSLAPVVGSSPRPPLSDPNSAPGPGTYEIANRAVEGPQYTMRGRELINEKETSPGPGHYDQNINDINIPNRSPAFSLGIAPRTDGSKPYPYPGPGTYETQGKEGGPKWVFGTESKAQDFKTENPGPGTYQYPDSLSKIGYTMAGKHPGSPKDTFPGPGTYDQNLDTGSPQWSMGKQPRTDLGKGNEVPGPGTYTVEDIRPHSLAPVMGSSPRPPLSDPNAAPGPGTYEIANRAVEGPQYTMRGREIGTNKERSPGPGHYNQDINDINIPNRSPAFSLGTAPRTDENKPYPFPGPGTYETQGKEGGPKWGFGTESRDNDYKTENPGPGTYQYPDSLSKIAYTMTGRNIESPKSNFPGPGTYEQNLETGSPQWSMGKQPRNDLGKGNNIPGPGTYTVEDVRPHSLAPVIGSSPRPPLSDPNSAPGPGTYEIPNRAVEGFHFTMRGREIVKDRDRSPGPGHYEQDINDINIPNRSPAFSMGTAPRTDQSKPAPFPGPGTYETQGKEGGPKWGFGTESKAQDFKTENPGPGTYQYSDTLSKIGYTMAGKHPGSPKDTFPGPGAYDQNFDTGSPQWSMGKQPRTDLGKGNEVPGPGTYTVEDIRPHSLAPVMGSSPRHPLSDPNAAPGPGTYEIANRAVEGPQYTMRGREIIINREKSPGPGHYDQNINDINIPNRSPVFSMGTAPRTDENKPYPFPGPGTYETQGKEGGPKWGFGTESRDKDYKTENPGPGTYQYPDSLSKIAYTMTGRNIESPKSNFPGPGTYEQNFETGSPQWSMGKQPRTDIGKGNNIPGPGTYTVEEVRPHSLAPVMGSSPRPPLSDPNSAPGPGAYEIANRAVEGPQYTMRGKEIKLDREKSPGPGHYDQNINDINIPNRSPAFSMGTGGRTDEKPYPYPGPGTYETQTSEGGPKWGFGLEPRDKDYRTENPGPGTYELPNAFSSTGFTMTGRNPEHLKDNFPGPGAYDQTIETGSPQWSMGKQPRTDLGKGNEVPGPGTYSLEEIRPHSIAPVIGTSPRPPLSDPNSAPGPGTYEIINRAVEGPQYTMRGREIGTNKQMSPGPGHYNQDINDINIPNKPPAFSMGTASRTDGLKQSFNPGPGTYDTQGKEGGPKWGFGTESKDKDYKTENPGPGSYEIPDVLSKEGYTMTGRNPDLSKDNFPGPGAYEQNLRTNSPKWSLGKEPRTDLGKGNDVPGPGTYTLEEARPHSLAPVIGSSPRAPLSDPNTAPGPGTYEIANKAVEGPQYTMRGRKITSDREKLPGPGHYDQDINDINMPNKPPVFSMGTAPRTDTLRLSSSPGPGTYETQGKEEGPRWRFGSEPKDKGFKKENPGPGSYEIPNTLSKKAFSMTGRSLESPKHNFPGPGAYEQNVRTTSPRWTMGKQPRNDLGKGNKVPGPGTYTFEEVRPHSKAPVIGSSPRAPLSDPNAAPGPGTYEIANRAVEGPQFTMRGRENKTDRENLPGPGHYDQDINDINMPNKSPVFTMGTAPRTDGSKPSQYPGPGTYETTGKEVGPKWGFGSESKDKDFKTENPGPGTYELPDTLSKTGYTMAGRNLESPKDIFPGPGTYDQNLDVGSPKWSMGKQPKTDIGKGNEVPGPGTYTVEDVRPHSIAPVMGTSSRPPLSDPNSAPGPGTYEIPNTAVEGPQYTMRGRETKVDRGNLPGPGHYDQNINDINMPNKSPVFSMGTAPRTDISKLSPYPGPGTYETQGKEVGPKWGFGSESKDTNFKTDNPGPGTYELPDTLSKTGYTMTSRNLESPKDNFPGPGTYDQNLDIGSPRWSMGKQSKTDIGKGNDVPGPGTYTIEEARPHSQAPVIGSSPRAPLSDPNAAPGPGTYEIANRAVEGPQFTMRGRENKTDRENLPGPGHYDQDINDINMPNKSPVFTMGTAPRIDGSKPSPYPGPGTYETQGKEVGPKWGFGSESKDKDFKTENPGPGTYELPDTLSKIGYTMTGRNLESPKDSFPGPGTYDQNLDVGSPKWSMGKQPRTDIGKGNEVPGPGTYTVEDIRPHSIAPVMGNSARPPLSDPNSAPGPGTYEIPNTAVEGPQYTMRGRETKVDRENLPGPGHYDQNINDINIKDKPPAFSMGTAPRTDGLKPSQYPGPGTYETTGKEVGPKWGFGSESKDKDFKTENPGPGTYELPDTLSKLGFTMAGRNLESPKDSFPGPGTYDQNLNVGSPQWSMGKQPKTDIGKGNEVPGPGTYTVEDVRPHSIAPVMGTSARPPLSDPNSAPGPGTYEIPNTAVEGPQYTMRGRETKADRENLPGPGHYDQNINDINTKDKPPAFSMGTAPRIDGSKPSPYPGPGTYDTEGKEAGPKWGFGSESKDKDFKTKNPGPGTYELPDTLSKIGYTMTGRNLESPKDSFPGPGTYDQNLNVGSPKWSMGKQPRTDIGKGNEVPGPGTYTVEDIRPHSIAPVMGNSARPPLSDPNSAPGPGTYEIPNTAVEGPQYTMRGRESKVNKDNLPGPGHYDQDINDINTKDKPPAFSMGTAPRTDGSKPSQYPGPGTYETIGKEVGPKWGFGSEPKDKNFETENPGPGTYELPNTLSKTGYTMRGKNSDLTKDNFPGPGTYDQNLDVGSPQWSMGKQPKTDQGKGNEIPGPGTYTVEEIRPHSIAPVMGSSARPPLSDPNSAPGPGTYEIPNKAIEGPQFTMRGREGKIDKDNLPGPGHYDQDMNDINMKDRPPAFSMGTAARTDQSKPSQYPGPGAYETNDKEGGPKWGFGSDPKDKDFRTENPGPGTYELPDTLSKTGFTMRARNPDAEKDNFPGPGTYEQNLDIKSPKWSMGKQPKTDNGKGNEIPGPGTYTVEEIRSHSLAPVIGLSARPPLSDPSTAPGPGTYEIPNKAVEGPQFTMRGRETKANKDGIPGPGHYDQDINDINMPNKSPVFSMGTAGRTDEKPYPYPGPGTYDTQGKEVGPKWGFGSEPKDKDYKTENPGPGTYEITDTQLKAGFTMKGRNPDMAKDNFPGPGTYDQNLNVGSPKWSMGKQPKTDIGKGNEVPGPGTYTVEEIRPHSIAPVLGSSSRPPLSDPNSAPGPGTYEIPNTAVDGPQYTMRGRETKINKDNLPGPGHYDQDTNDINIKDRPPAFSMGTAARTDGSKPSHFPGPGTYDTEGKEGGPKWGFGTESKDKDFKKENPGPGTYEIPNTLSNIGFSMKGKNVDLAKDNFPGPGTYEQNPRLNSPQWSMGKQPRDDKGKGSDIPGPGTYTVEEVRPHSNAPVISSSIRPPLSDPGTAPGPGTYEIPNRAVEGPQFSLRGRETKANKDNLPGPGHYDQDINDINTKDKPPAFSMGTAPRTDGSKPSQNPGPGTYETSGKEGGPKWGFGSDTKEKDFKTENPGPGTYELPNTLSKTAFSLTGRNLEATKDNFPGPGTYDQNLRPTSPKWSMSKNPRSDQGKGPEIPGPGTYDVEEIRPHSLAPVLGSSSRPPLNDPGTAPGPGTYDVPNKAVEGPRFTIRGRKSIKDRENLPGPGHYNQDINDINAPDKPPAYSMGSAPRVDGIKPSLNPGPGTYDTQGKEAGPKWGFGSEPKEKSPKSENPGPGTYEAPNTLSKTAFSIKGRNPEASKDNFPGPGTYDQELELKSPKWSMGKQARIDNGKFPETPGPGTYTFEEIRPHSKAPVMGVSPRAPFSDENTSPGPGTYEIPNKAVEGPQFTMRGREGKIGKEDLPGPGHYDQDANEVNIKEKAPAFSMGTASRTDFGKVVENPGPGTYDTRGKEQGPKWGFGSETKDKNFKNPLPGPGAYELPSGLSKTGYSLTGRKKDKNPENFPGPGSYEPAGRSKSPSWSMGKQSKTDSGKVINTIPGPGAYTTEEIRPHSIAPVIGSSQRPPLNDIITSPGPGTYETSTKAVEGPQFTIRGREGKSIKNTNPGPGHYDQSSNDVNIKERAPTYRIGSASRTEMLKRSEMPGPGMYDTRGKEAGPKWGFGSESRHKDLRIAIPGPGSYEVTSTLPKGGYSLTSRNKEKNPENFPGPGSYDTNFRPKSPSWTMGKQSKSTKALPLVPGPGAYNAEDNHPHKTGPVIGTSQRPPLSEPQPTPGPGTYDLSPKAVEGPQFSMRGRENIKFLSNSPGPGEYEQDINDINIKEKPPAYKIGSASRTDNKKPSLNPGPGQYDTRGKELGPKWGFGSESKNKDLKLNMPGPGAYEIQTTLTKRGFSMTSRHKDKNPEALPGPGSYENKVRTKSPSWTMGKQSKSKTLTGLNNVPGPGSYSTGNLRPNSSVTAFGTAKRLPLGDVNPAPGPGTYEVAQKIGEGPQFSMRGRDEKIEIKDSPGPGYYDQELNDVNTKNKAQNWKIGSAPRADLTKPPSIPGPGQYDTRGKEAGPRWGFGSEPRSRKIKEDNPGPGSYVIQAAMSKTSYSITGRKNEFKKDNFPGPGSYDSPDREVSPKWTISKTSRDPESKPQDTSPGPGEYSPQGSINEIGPVFGTSNRPPLTFIQTGPGPGSYAVGNIPVLSPSYSIRPKIGTVKHNQNPGPGQYDPKQPQGDPKWSLGKDKKAFDYGLAKSSSSPGPGFYNLRKDPPGPHWGFGTSSRDQNPKSEGPGPGQYEYNPSISNLPPYAVPKQD